MPCCPEGARTDHFPAVEVVVGMGAVICSPVSPAVIRMFSKSWDLIFFLQAMHKHASEIQHNWSWEEDALCPQPAASRRYSDI